MGGLGFLHTADAHVETFGALMGELAPTLAHRHVVRGDLLDRARREGLRAPGLAEEVRSALGDLAAAPVGVVLCTCSTIGGLAEECGAGLGLPVVRVDRAMAELAVRSGRRIAVVAALQSTIAPTRELLAGAAAAAGARVEILDSPCLHVWAAFETGDIAGYYRLIAEHVDAVDPSVDVVVLAQASMAPAAELTRGRRPVLSSPRPGVEAACRLAGGRADPSTAYLRQRRSSAA